MEGPDDEIRRMDIFQTMSLVRTRDLLPLANQLVWERLVQLGLYDGNPNPEVPPEYRYTRSKILSMERDTDNFVEVLGLLPQVKQMVIDSQKIQFSDLPPEVLVNILGRVSPTAREGVLVSRDMKELADIALMDNIRTNNLVDPTIGAVNRNEYFKVDAEGNGEYFSPKPGLWRELKASRFPIDDTVYDVDGKRLAPDRVERLKRSTLKKKIFDKLTNSKTVLIYGNSSVFKFVGIFYMLNVSLYSALATRREWSLRLLSATKKSILYLNVEDLVQFLASGGELSDYRNITIHGKLLHYSNNPEVNVYLIPINKYNLQNAQVILPSIRDDVRII